MYDLTKRPLHHCVQRVSAFGLDFRVSSSVLSSQDRSFRGNSALSTSLCFTVYLSILSVAMAPSLEDMESTTTNGDVQIDKKITAWQQPGPAACDFRSVYFVLLSKLLALTGANR